MFDLYMQSPSGEFGAYVGSFVTEDEALEFMGENERSGEDWEIRYSGKHECQNRRRYNHVLSYNSKMSPVAKHDGNYTGKHEKIAEIIAELSELFAEVAEALEVTEEFIAEICGYVSAKLARYDVRKIAPMKIMERICVDGMWHWFDTNSAEKVRNMARRGLVRIREVIPYAGIV